MLSKKSQAGRSMVEMLGVLAIIGVLSIGGIAGYTMSMRRHRAHQILDVVNKYDSIVYAECQKAIIDGKISHITQCSMNPNFSRYIPVSFEEADLGILADTTYVGLSETFQNDGIDTLEIDVTFRDYEICKTVKSIISSKIETDCNDGIGIHLRVPVKFN